MGTDPFTKTWWFLEAHDGSWLADAKHELFTRDPNEAMKWPNKTLAGGAGQGLHNALWLKIKAPTEHEFVASADEAPALPPTCGDCRFWWRDGHNCPPGGEAYGSHHEDGSRFLGHGQVRMCRRNPRYVWRGEAEWCGEFRASAA